MKLKSHHKLINGRLSNSVMLKDNLSYFQDKTLTITVEEWKPKRSNQQNNYYWGVIVPIWKNLLKEEWGEIRSIKDTHEFLKYNCNYTEIVKEDTGEVLKLAKSTTRNNTKDQETFHEGCRQLAYEMFNVQIPLPNENSTLDL